MYSVYPNSNNLISVVMGKNINFTWRGQSDVRVGVKFKEWLEFIRKNFEFIKERPIINYKSLFIQDNTHNAVKVFYYDIAWAQYCELAISSNAGKDATVIIPIFDSSNESVENINLDQVHNFINALSDEIIENLTNILVGLNLHYSRLGISYCQATIAEIKPDYLTSHNQMIWELCLFLLYCAVDSNSNFKFNIEWR